MNMQKFEERLTQHEVAHDERIHEVVRDEQIDEVVHDEVMVEELMITSLLIDNFTLY